MLSRQPRESRDPSSKAGGTDLGAFLPAHPCRAETRLSPSARSGGPTRGGVEDGRLIGDRTRSLITL